MMDAVCGSCHPLYMDGLSHVLVARLHKQCFLVVSPTGWLCSYGLFLLLLGHHETFEMLPVDHATVNLELTEGVINLCGTELLAPGHEGVAEHFRIDLSVNF